MIANSIKENLDGLATVDNFAERHLFGYLLKLLRPPSTLSTKEYAETNIWLSSDESANPGKMSFDLTPHMIYPMECMDNPDIHIIIGIKSAQIAWTRTTLTYQQRIIAEDPQNMIMVFPSVKQSQKFAREKQKPAIRSSAKLRELIGDPDRCSFQFYKYPGGWLSFVTARSTSDLKSSSAPIVIIEEPDELLFDVGDQGDPLELAAQRMKTFPNRLLIYAGTPTIEGKSRVMDAYKLSNMMEYRVQCRSCGKHQAFNFAYLQYYSYADGHVHKEYGRFDPATAHYLCKFCGTAHDDSDRHRMIDNALNYGRHGWFPNRPEELEKYGFAFNELMSKFAASTHFELAKTKIKAGLALEKGDETLMKSYMNNQCGLPFASKLVGVDIEDFRSRKLDYPEGYVNYGGLVLTAAIDVQHNRFAISVRAHGRNNCSWLVLWIEVFGNVADPDDQVWVKLTELVTTKYPHMRQGPNGENYFLPVSRIGIDCSDGNTSEVVYAWVHAMCASGYEVMAIKGSSDLNFNAEIYTEPANEDDPEGRALRNSLASRMGVNVFIMGAHKAHEELVRRIGLTGTKDRMYHNKQSYSETGEIAEYEHQILSCVKQYSPNGKKFTYELKNGHRKEAADCEKMNICISYSLNLRHLTEKEWQNIEFSIFGVR
jgi:phage terminase large subunit GpA-like protein